MNTDWINEVSFNGDGLIPAIAQDYRSNRILMVAWMNRDALLQTATESQAVYWSRSRQAFWRKGETSGNEQRIVEIQLDCDGDVIILRVDQTGDIACHTGRNSCFFRKLTERGWEVTEPVLKDPREMYPDG
ncbi:MAG: phosphoribosyl-AMP cyclohydrolase [Gammaproteobacteria bacterium]